MGRAFFSAMATATQALDTQPKLQTQFVVELPEEFAQSLHEWFQKASKYEEPGGINKFASQVLECALADYRLEKLPAPPPEEEEHDRRRGKLTAFQEAQIVEDYADDNDCGITELALRYEVDRSTIRRIILKHEAATGIAIKRKPHLTEAQLAEIRRLRAEGATWVELGKQFDRTATGLSSICCVWSKKKVTA
jgi:transposase-like protein